MRYRSITSALACVLLFVALAGPAAGQTSELDVPDGYRLEARREVAPGLQHLRLSRDTPRQVVNVARLHKGAGLSLRAVLSNQAVAGPAPRMERTSSMCIRVQCLAAVNGDFYFPESGEPVGGLISSGEVILSPSQAHHQLVLGDEGPAAAHLELTGTIMPTDLQPVEIDAVNRQRAANQIVLYTPAFGSTTGTNPHGAELTMEVLRPPGPIRMGQTALVRMVGLQEGVGDTPIPNAGGVLSGHDRGAQALTALWRRAQAQEIGPELLVRFDSTPEATESLGGTPILLREGRLWFADEPTTFVRGRHPRTIVGWNPSGDILLVTIDGRQPGYSLGMSLAETADLMLALGATEAINLDGGGSTTFVVKGRVENRPSDRLVRGSAGPRIAHVPGNGESTSGNLERPVAVALAVVAVSAGPVSAGALSEGLGLPETVPLAPPAADPGSTPHAALPALVWQPSPAADLRLVVIAVLANVLASLALAGRRRIRLVS